MKKTLLIGILSLPFISLADEPKKESTSPVAPPPAAPAKSEPTPVSSAPPAAQGSPTAPSAEEKVDVTVEITGNDQMQYDKKAFSVNAGQKVKLSFKHIGKLPKVAMGHNVVILKKGVNKVTFAQQALAGGAPDYMPKDKKDILVHTKQIGGGQQDSIIFTAPEAGNYDYLCTFPGHFALMSGVMSVK